jgi:hypothetical protein
MKPYPLALLNHLTVPFRRSTYPRFLHVPSYLGAQDVPAVLYDAFWSEGVGVSRESQKAEGKMQKLEACRERLGGTVLLCDSGPHEAGPCRRRCKLLGVPRFARDDRLKKRVGPQSGIGPSLLSVMRCCSQSTEEMVLPSRMVPLVTMRTAVGSGTSRL